MSKHVKLTESQLVKIIQKVINEQDETNFKEPDPKLFAMSNSKSSVKSDSQQSSLSEDNDENEDDDF